MTDIRDWILSLDAERTFEIKSDSDLVMKVKSLQNQKVISRQNQGKQPPKFKGMLTTVAGVPKTMRVRPIQLLHKIGRMTTPAIPSLMRLSTIGMIFHYIWVFAPNATNFKRGHVPKLYLSQDARDLNFHMKTLLSDNFGIGFAGYIMEERFGLSGHIDVEDALKINMFTRRIHKIGRKSPDYLFWREPFHDKSYLYLVECKGTTTTRSQSYKQICSGTEQLPSIIGVKNSLTSIVSAACMLKYRTVVNMIDPPPEDDTTNSYIVRNADRFPEQLAKLSWLKKLAFAYPYTHDRVRALFDEGEIGYVPPELRPVEKFDSELGTFYGNTQRMIVNGVQVSVFRGIYSEFLEGDNYLSSLKRWYEKFEPSRNEDEMEELHHRNRSNITMKYVDSEENWIYNIDISGTILKISFCKV